MPLQSNEPGSVDVQCSIKIVEPGVSADYEPSPWTSGRYAYDITRRSAMFDDIPRGFHLLPSWMDMRAYKYSVGQMLLAGMGHEVEILEADLVHAYYNQFLETCNPKLGVIGKSRLPYKTIASIGVSSNMLFEVESENDFYNADLLWPDEWDVFYIDRDSSSIFYRFTNGQYRQVLVNGVLNLEVSAYQVYNELDQIGSLFGIERLPFENNNAYRARIKDVFSDTTYDGQTVKKLGNSTELGMVFAIARELGIPSQRVDGELSISIASPSNPVWAAENLFDLNGLPNDLFYSLVGEIARQTKTRWGEFLFKNSRWIKRSPTMSIPSLSTIWDFATKEDE